MTIQAKATAFIIFIPLFLGAQSNSSCRSSAPANRPAPVANSSPEKRVDKPSTNNSPSADPASKNKNMSNTPTKKGSHVPAGTWGGDHIRAIVRANGADLEYDCANGTISGPLEMDSEGRFEGAGTHAREGGPVRIDKPASGRPVRYKGKIKGDEMTLIITFAENSESVGTFTLTHGNEGRLWKCR